MEENKDVNLVGIVGVIETVLHVIMDNTYMCLQQIPVVLSNTDLVKFRLLLASNTYLWNGFNGFLVLKK